MVDVLMKQHTFGRAPILAPVTEVTGANLLDVLNRATPIFEKNSAECEYLYNYYKGKQPILYRQKEIRPEICNTIVVNRAYEITTFKTGRFLYKDIQYVNRGDNTIDEVNALNSIMYQEGKAGQDRQLVDWFHICGHSYRLILDAKRSEGTPFHIYPIEPTRAFVIYSDTVQRQPLVGVYVTDVLADDGVTIEKVYTAYTKREVFTVKNSEIIEARPHFLGDVPLVEYPANYARLGCFEVVMELLDAINLCQSNRLDGVEQFIQALMVFKNLDVDNEDMNKLKQSGAICLPEGSDVDYLVHELNQSQAQTLVDDMYQAVLTICGMPNRQKGATSTSDNKGAVVLRDGWTSAGTAVKETRQYFEASERRMLKMALKLFNVYRDADAVVKPDRKPLDLSDIDVHFDEGEYDNMLEKAQVLTMLLSNDRVHPKDAFKFSNITPDPESAYISGQEFHDEQEAKAVKELMENNDVRVHGQGSDETDPEDGSALQ